MTSPDRELSDRIATEAEHAEDERDVDLVRRRLADDRPWLSEDGLEAALQRALAAASGQKPA